MWDKNVNLKIFKNYINFKTEFLNCPEIKQILKLSKCLFNNFDNLFVKY